jgi:hypothetical protein
LYGRLVDIADAWTAAIKDVRDSKLSDDPSLKGVKVSNLEEARNASAPAGRLLDQMNAFSRIAGDVELLSDHDVRIAVAALHAVLRRAARAAIGGGDLVSDIAPARSVALRVMRWELVHGTAVELPDDASEETSHPS